MFFIFLNSISILLLICLYAITSYFFIFEKQIKYTIKSAIYIGILIFLFKIILPIVLYYYHN
ncbi:hypothetical protein BG590_08285 [Mannheimia haemolytica]|nr:hypothetical protein F382_03645 [Mannheimia haemolytica D153]AGR75566.1 hypothetical protein N220_09745 [Mannheimia haemolytica USMARC_2286]AKA10964.1 hypothetical protein WC39_04445 [Mannheimia haemolytica]ASW16613.1 hypothetical protein D650_27775 [Mannheimia haemolytica USDA-ARS-USMARC-183]AWW71046.1 hypothetical protein C4O86_04200 [Pasteurellaceae bacterium 12565]EPZ00475.1 hypothetical protein L279_13620 [Mannheimia haemolytica D38]EPZ24512.1 hypothetical protein L277_12160 [Mannheim